MAVFNFNSNAFGSTQSSRGLIICFNQRLSTFYSGEVVLNAIHRRGIFSKLCSGVLLLKESREKIVSKLDALQRSNVARRNSYRESVKLNAELQSVDLE